MRCCVHHRLSSLETTKEHRSYEYDIRGKMRITSSPRHLRISQRNICTGYVQRNSPGATKRLHVYEYCVSVVPPLLTRTTCILLYSYYTTAVLRGDARERRKTHLYANDSDARAPREGFPRARPARTAALSLASPPPLGRQENGGCCRREPGGPRKNDIRRLLFTIHLDESLYQRQQAPVVLLL